MRRQILVFTISLFFASNGLSQSFDWANLFENSRGDAQIQRVKYDNSGNLIVFGKYFNQIKLGSGASLTTLSNPSGEAYFIAKYDQTFNVVWARDIPVETAISEYNQVGLTTDDGNNVYVTANYQGAITIGGNTYTDAGSFFFVAKYDVDGNFQFENRYTATGIIESRDLALDINGGIYIAGHFSADVTFGSLSPLTSNGDRDIFILQLGPSGNPVAQRQIGGTNREEAAGIEVEGTNEIYLAGMFQSDISLIIGGVPVTINPTSTSQSDVFLAKFLGLINPDGLVSGGGVGTDQITDIELSTDANDIYVTGYYSNDFTFQGSSTTLNSLGFQDVFTASLTIDFTENWIASGGGTRFDYAYGITVDTNELYITGSYAGSASFGGQNIATGSNLTSNFFITEYDNSTGNVLSATSANSIDDNSFNFGIDHDAANGNLMTGGQYVGYVEFNSEFFSAGSEDDMSLIQTSLSDLNNVNFLTGSGYYYLNIFASEADISGNLYVGGTIGGTYKDATTGNYVGRGGSDMFLARFDTNGNLIWFTGAGGPEDDELTSIAIDPSTSEILTTGTFSNSFSTTTTTISGESIDDIFLAKYQNDGTNSWVVNAISASDQLSVNDVAVDGNSNIFLGGNKGTTDDTDFNGVVIAASGDKYFLAKYGSNGVGIDVDIQPAFEVSAVAIDNNNNVIVGGSFSDFTPSINFGGNTLTSAGSFDVLAAKYDNNLNLNWVRQAGGSQFDQIQSIDTDSNGDIAVVGYFRSSATFGTETVTGSNYDMFVAKYLANGDFSWVRTGGGSSRDEAEDVIIDGADNIIVTGWFGGSAFFDCFPLTGASAEDQDIFISRYTTDGNIDFAEKLGHPILSCSECTVSEEPYGLSLDGSGNFYLSGKITGTTEFGSITLPAPDDETSYFASKFSISIMTCPPPPVLNTLYWSDPGFPAILTAMTDGSDQFAFGGGSFSTPSALVVDENRGIIFYTDTDLSQIIRLDVNGGTIENQQTIVDLSSSGTGPGDLEFDNINKKLYWSVDNGDIQRSDPDGSNIETVIIGQEAAGIAIDPAESKIYWTTNVNLPSSPAPEVRRADYGGGDLETIYSTGSAVMGEIEIDATNGRVYWTEVDNNQILSSELEGGDQQTVLSGVAVTFGLSLSPQDGLLYYFDALTGFNSANLDGSNDTNLPITADGPLFVTLSQDIDIATTTFAAFSFTGTPCVGNSLVFSDESETGALTIIDYLWEFGDGNTSSNSSPSYSYNAAGTYNVGLTITLSDASTLTVNNPIEIYDFPEITLDSDFTICETQATVNLNATVTSVLSASYSWSTSGNGSFDNSFMEDPVYTIGSTDIANGSVTLTLSVIDADTPCGSVSSAITIFIENEPMVNAGQDQNICSDEVVNLSGTINDGNIDQWTTSGDGSFDDPTSINAIYTPGTSDINNGSVIISLSANSATGACAQVADNLVVNLSESLTVDAGVDVSVCAMDILSLSATASGDIASLSWTSTGDGSFSNNTSLSTSYTPGPGDISSVFVTLTLTATSTGSCASVTDEVEIEVLGTPEARNYLLDAEIGLPLNINLQADNETDESGALTLEIIEEPTKGTLEFDGSIAIYTANNETIGTDNIMYEITGACGSDQENITLNILNNPPAIDPPSGNIPQGEPVTISLENAFSDLNGNLDLSTLQIIEDPISGAPARLDGLNLTVDYTGISFRGIDEVVIGICDDQGACTEATILIEVVPQQIIVYNAVSPNGDGFNDYWQIENLFAPNEIKLYNRWGDEVKKLVDYSGEIPNNKLNDLPPGTYFYEITSTNGNARGYLVLKK